MFTVYCPQHGSHVLLGTSRIRAMANVEPGVIAVELECYDGELLTLLTGSAVHEHQVRTDRKPATLSR